MICGFLEKTKSAIVALSLLTASLVGISLPQANSAQILTICKSLKSETQIISKTNACNEKLYEKIVWHLAGNSPKGTPGSKQISITTCRSKGRVGLEVIRKNCNRASETKSSWERPLGPPDAPSIISVTPNINGSAIIEVKAPSNNGGARINSYSVVQIDDKSNSSKSSTGSNFLGTSVVSYPLKYQEKIPVGGLTPGKRYRFAVVATNAAGTSQISESSEEFVVPSTPISPTITSVVALGPGSALVSFEAFNHDFSSPTTSFTISAQPGGLQSIVSSPLLRSHTFTGLSHSTQYTFTIVANSAAGSSSPSEQSTAITTFSVQPQVEPAQSFPAATAPASVALPVFGLSSTSETSTAGVALTGYTISSTGGAIAAYSISPSAPAGLTFNTTTGLLSGTPTAVASATTYTITGTNATGSATATFDLVVTLGAPAFTISSSSESRGTGSSLTGYTISSTGGLIDSYSISPSAPAGLTFDTTTGLFSGTPTSVASATTYTITGTNATGTATATFELTVTLGAPAFTLSSSSETRSVNTTATGFTVSSTGGEIASYSISPSAPAGMSFDTTTGAFSGIPTAIAPATTYTVTATNATGTTSVDFSLTVTFGSASKAMITTQPSGAVNGVALTTQPVVRITDSAGNTVTTSSVNVVASIASGTGTLTGTAIVAAVNGVATFTDLGLSGTAGNFTLTFTPTSLTAATSNGFALSFGAAATAMVTTQPSGAAAGTTFTTQPVIRIVDASGNTVTSSTVNVVASIASGTGTLSGTTTITAVSGIATFTDLAISGSGTHTITFTPTSLTAITSNSVSLSAGAAAQALITTQPSGAAAGSAFTTQPVIRITDSSGNTVTTSAVNVVASIASGTGTLSGTTTITAVNGVATYTNLVLSGSTGNFTLAFTPTSLTAATSSSFALGVGAVSKAMITAQPSGAVNGVALTSQPVVRITDSSENTVTTSTVNVVVSIGSGSGGTLSGTTTVATVNGVATFTDLVLSGTVGNFTLTFTPTSLTSATSSSFALSAGAASKAMITTQPSGAVNGSAFTTQPVIRITDAGGNTITSSSANIVVSIASGTGTLSGTTTVVAVNGVATFTNLAISGTGNYTLTFTPAGGLTAVTSSTINVTEVTCAQGGSCALGDTGPGGGKVFYYSAVGFSCGPTFASTCNYLEVAPSTWSGSADTAYRWDPTGGDDVHPNIPNNADPHLLTAEIGLGYKNSVQLFNFYGDNNDYAAGAARRYTSNGKSDWYLGSAVEMNLLCDWSKGQAATPTVSCGSGAMLQGNFRAESSDAYWTSSEGITNEYFDARKQTFTASAAAGQDHKSFQRYVRPIRSF